MEGKVIPWNENDVKEILNWKDPLSFNRTILHYFALYDKQGKSNMKFLQSYLTRSVLNAKDLSGNTCLHNAAEKNNVSFLNCILEEHKQVS